MPTPAQSRAAAAHKAKRQEAGEKVVSVWLSKMARDRLDVLAKDYKSKQGALEALLLDPATTVAPTPSKPVSEPGKGLSSCPPGYRPVSGDAEASADNPGMPIRLERIPKASAFKPHPKPTKGKK
jgi:hypothetical protein